jgi:hypothetical protein
MSGRLAATHFVQCKGKSNSGNLRDLARDINVYVTFPGSPVLAQARVSSLRTDLQMHVRLTIWGTLAPMLETHGRSPSAMSWLGLTGDQ